MKCEIHISKFKDKISNENIAYSKINVVEHLKIIIFFFVFKKKYSQIIYCLLTRTISINHVRVVLVV